MVHFLFAELFVSLTSVLLVPQELRKNKNEILRMDVVLMIAVLIISLNEISYTNQFDKLKIMPGQLGMVCNSIVLFCQKV